jgi:hypothetical protein
MKTDRELLELAAKAAKDLGLKLECPDDDDGIYISRSHGRNGHTWNPLTDDGDALRLSVMLGITIECDFNDSDACTAFQTRGDILADEYSGMLGEYIGEVEFAATRRAIVRAAAAIGEQTK